MVTVTCKCISKDEGKFNHPRCDENGDVVYDKEGNPREILVGTFWNVHFTFLESEKYSGDWQKTRQPGGYMPLTALTPEAAAQFEVGKIYRLTLVEEEAQA